MIHNNLKTELNTKNNWNLRQKQQCVTLQLVSESTASYISAAIFIAFDPWKLTDFSVFYSIDNIWCCRVSLAQLELSDKEYRSQFVGISSWCWCCHLNKSWNKNYRLWFNMEILK